MSGRKSNTSPIAPNAKITGSLSKTRHSLNLRAVALLGVLIALFIAIGSLFGVLGAATALAMAIILCFWSYWSVVPSLLAQSNAVPSTDAAVLQATAELAARAGIPLPCVYEIDDAQPNALALGPNPEAAVLILTRALRRQLTSGELRAVIGHEIAHIRNRDTLSSTIAATLVGAIVSLASLLALIGLAARRRGGAAIIVLAALAPLIALIVKLAMMRSIEYRADRDGAHLCGGPEDLISALRKLDLLTKRTSSGAASIQPALAPLFFVDPLPDSWLGTLFSPHPTIASRIARLEALIKN